MRFRAAALALAITSGAACAHARGPTGAPAGAGAPDSAAQQRARDSGFVALVMEDLARPDPADEHLARLLDERGQLFERLIAMVQADTQLVRIAPTFTWTTATVAWPRPESELGVSRERWEEYRRLFRVLDLEAGVLRRPGERPGVIYLLARTKGLVTGGSVKGYAYSDSVLGPQCASLDRPPGGRKGICFKPLRGHWYLYYEWG